MIDRKKNLIFLVSCCMLDVKKINLELKIKVDFFILFYKII
jgi:hypothetical protein